MLQNRITKAVIPAAGLGKRLLPLTKSVPKEMLPFGRKPIIQWVVEEALESGLNEICIVIRVGKEIIRDFFSTGNSELSWQQESLRGSEDLLRHCELQFTYQEKPLGLGNALMEAREFIGNNPFMMLIPDQMIMAGKPGALQISEQASWDRNSIWSSMVKLDNAERHLFKGSRGFDFSPISSNRFKIHGLLLEEDVQRKFRNKRYEIRGFGRTIFPPGFLDYVTNEYINPATGEVDLLRSFEACKNTFAHFGIFLEGDAYDLGSFDGYYHFLQKYLRDYFV